MFSKIRFNFATLFKQNVKSLDNRNHTLVGDYINIIKTTLELNFYLYQAFAQHGLYTKTLKQREAVNYKSFSLITYKCVIGKKLNNN